MAHGRKEETKKITQKSRNNQSSIGKKTYEEKYVSTLHAWIQNLSCSQLIFFSQSTHLTAPGHN